MGKNKSNFFEYPIKRLFDVLLTVFVISGVGTLLRRLSVIPYDLPITTAYVFYGVEILLILGIQFVTMKGYYASTATFGGYIRTNILAYLIVTLLACVVMKFFDHTFLYSWLFCPFKLFSLGGAVSPVVSAAIVGGLMYIITLIYHRIYFIMG